MTTIPVPLPSGTIDVFDSGGDAPPIVFSHGVVVDHTKLRGVLDQLAPEFRCVVTSCRSAVIGDPCRRTPNSPSAGPRCSSQRTVEALGVSPAVLAANHWGGPQTTPAERSALITGLVLTEAEGFETPFGAPERIRLRCRVGSPDRLRIAGRSLRVAGFQRASHDLRQDDGPPDADAPHSCIDRGSSPTPVFAATLAGTSPRLPSTRRRGCC